MYLEHLGGVFAPSFFVFCFGFYVCKYLIKLSTFMAFFVALVKTAIPTVYFTFYSDTTWTLIDDIIYYSKSLEIVAGLPSLIEIDLETMPAILTSIQQTAGTSHWLYFSWNCLALLLFGDHYFSAVFLNVALTFVAGYLFLNVVEYIGVRGKDCRTLVIFFLLHWDVISWSSFINIKDTLVMTLNIMTVASLLKILIGKNRTLGFPYLIISQILLTVTRFYLVFAWIGTYFISQLTLQRKFVQVLLFVCVFAICAYLAGNFFPMLTLSFLDESVGAQDLTTLPAVGIIRYLLSPSPDNYYNPEYSFAVVAFVLNHLFFPLFILGFVKLSKNNRAFVPIMAFLAINLILNGVFPELVTPRKRYPICWILALCQFYGFSVLFKSTSLNRINCKDSI